MAWTKVKQTLMPCKKDEEEEEEEEEVDDSSSDEEDMKVFKCDIPKKKMDIGIPCTVDSCYI